MEVYAEGEAFITLKDHKDNFNSVIRPALGRVSATKLCCMFLAGRKSWYLKGAVAPVHTMFQVPVQRQTQSVWCKMPEGSLLQIYRILMSTVTATVTCSLPGSFQPIPAGFLQLNKSCRNMAHKTARHGGDDIIVKYRSWSRCSLADGKSYSFQHTIHTVVWLTRIVLH